jgi:hypothetical protein
MSEIALVKRGPVVLDERESAAVRRILFETIDGLGELNQKRWRRFWNRLLKAEPGEIVTVTTKTKRSGPFHRRHMLIETRVFEAQERIGDFEAFRLWLKIGAGFVTWMAGPKGGVVPVPKSISYERCEEGEMREFHENAVHFLREPHAIKFLWPKMPEAQRVQAMDVLLLEFDE